MSQLMVRAESSAVTEGVFFALSEDNQSLGFAVRDTGQDEQGNTIRFWSEFQRLGGLDRLGYPISRVYRDGDGHYSQLFQRALLRWEQREHSAALAPIMDMLHDIGADRELEALGVPRPVLDADSSAKPESLSSHFPWLTDLRIRSHFLAARETFGTSRDVAPYGLPRSFPVRIGAFTIQRFQSVVLQVWDEYVPGMPLPGNVVLALAGNLYRDQLNESGDGADGRFSPERETAVLGVSTVAPRQNLAPEIALAVKLMAQSPEGAALASALMSQDIEIVFNDNVALAGFVPWQRSVAINPRWRGIDPNTLATVLAHEAVHVSDFIRGVEVNTRSACYDAEIRALQAQARIWQGYYGPNGKGKFDNSLDQMMDDTLYDVLRHSPGQFAALVSQVYASQCEPYEG